MPEATIDAAPPDDLLVGLARGGDRTAMEELFRRHAGVAYRVAYRLLGHEQDAHDAVQDGLLKAMTHLDDFDGRSGFRTWLLRIVTNTSLDWRRRRKRHPSLQIGDGNPDDVRESSANDDPARRMHQQDLRHALDQALNRLTETIRTTFVLFAELGMSYKEIAETQNVPIGTVMSRIHAAREKLQADLDWNRLNGLE
jgi:RNA polymerase sigma-70 factor (ECF subfamily)